MVVHRSAPGAWGSWRGRPIPTGPGLAGGSCAATAAAEASAQHAASPSRRTTGPTRDRAIRDGHRGSFGASPSAELPPDFICRAEGDLTGSDRLRRDRDHGGMCPQRHLVVRYRRIGRHPRRPSLPPGFRQRCRDRCRTRRIPAGTGRFNGRRRRKTGSRGAARDAESALPEFAGRVGCTPNRPFCKALANLAARSRRAARDPAYRPVVAAVRRTTDSGSRWCAAGGSRPPRPVPHAAGPRYSRMPRSLALRTAATRLAAESFR